MVLTDLVVEGTERLGAHFQLHDLHRCGRDVVLAYGHVGPEPEQGVQLYGVAVRRRAQEVVDPDGRVQTYGVQGLPTGRLVGRSMAGDVRMEQDGGN